jgi:hypothetical protein
LTIKANLRARRRRRRILWISVLAVVAALIVVAYFVAASFSNPWTGYIDKPVSPTLSQGLAAFSTSTLASVGGGTGKAPSSISGSALTNDSKPEVLYVGGEYCPYCAVTRWSLVIALSKFGNFTGLEYMLSSGTDVNANTPTFTFVNATYTSNYVSFVAVEHWDRSQNILQPFTSTEQSIYTQYDTGGIPFVDFANQYLINGAPGGLGVIDLSNKNWTQVATLLNQPTSSAAQAIVGEANYMISTICAIDGGSPSSVCSQSYATQPLAFTAAPSETTQQSLAVPYPGRVDQPWTV